MANIISRWRGALYIVNITLYDVLKPTSQLTVQYIPVAASVTQQAL